MTTFLNAELNKSDDYDDKGINSCKMSKIKMIKIDVQSFWVELHSCCTFYFQPNCIRNHHTEFENDRTILT